MNAENHYDLSLREQNPEKYDVYHKGNHIGYISVINGKLICTHEAECFYSATTDRTDCLSYNERVGQLTEAVNQFHKKLTKSKKKKYTNYTSFRIFKSGVQILPSEFELTDKDNIDLLQNEVNDLKNGFENLKDRFDGLVLQLRFMHNIFL